MSSNPALRPLPPDKLPPVKLPPDGEDRFSFADWFWPILSILLCTIFMLLCFFAPGNAGDSPHKSTPPDNLFPAEKQVPFPADENIPEEEK